MADPYMSRIGKVDFFAAVLPGLYIVGSVGIVLAALSTEHSPGQFWESLVNSLGSDKVAPYFLILLSIVLLFASYVVGIVLRAIPCGVADWVSGHWTRFLIRVVRRCKRTLGSWIRGRGVPSAQDGNRELYWHLRSTIYFDEYPYPEALKGVYEWLQKSLRNIPEHRVGDWSNVTSIAYWKMTLCVRCPNAFAHAQSIEARIRFHSGMIWATLVGVVCAASGSLLSSAAWRSPVRGLLVLSLLLALLLISTYRRARGAEPLEVFFAYLCCLDSESAVASTTTDDGEDPI